ncbi:LAME_0G08856g1_1 [Lachancea meyersii CBS 8951]|uniref:Structural maintenance of chromosomes protein n=1 Tax=Lachancea meyersii CBS 8951 TaxID=1266667 RepID=A0A1G4K8F7_9SACH|nr:LAME_0G08856g1_1 [Lachancea meyersii CBS 8951]
MDSPLSKKQKTHVSQNEDSSFEEDSVDVTRASRSRTPRKLVLGSPSKQFAVSQPGNSSSSNVPFLQPLRDDFLSSRSCVYSQSPPRSPNRSPTRKLELIQLSPTKKTRLEIQKLQETQNGLQPVQRLCISRLVLTNFKSYAGTQVVGPFDTSFSAVVGPNGSGKSNVIDSLLFVFGFRANKMRQGRLSDLIHKSEAFPALSFCQVDIFFQYVQDEPDGKTTVNKTKQELVVSRKAWRNSSSKYYVNCTESSFTQVTQLLRKEGIDMDHKRFLILQGEVESIAQMKPKAEKESDDGLLEYLEDIIGTAHYKQLIEQTLVEIEQLNETCQEKENRYEIVEREKSSLESGKDEALEFLRKEKELTILRSKLLQHSLWQSDTKLTNVKQKKITLEEKLTRERETYIHHQQEVKELEDHSRSLKSKLADLKEKERALRLKKRDCDRDKISAEERLKNLNQKRVKSEKSQNLTQASIGKIETKLNELLKGQEQYGGELAELNVNLCEEKGKLDEIKLSLKDKTGAISDEIAKIQRDLEPWNARLQAKTSQLKLEETTISVLKESHVKIIQEIKDAENQVVSLNERTAELRETISSLNKEGVSVKTQLKMGQSECDNATVKIKEMKAVLTAHRQRSVDARSSLSTFENKNKVLAALIRLKKSGRISGFYGRLGDLGVIDDKFDVAISTACPRLDDIVVDTVECAQQCIEYLRKNKLGYARFILLDKLRNFNLRPIPTPNNVPRLYDLVRPHDEKFKNAFYSVLRDTLVAKDLGEANRVAYGKQRFRVVTLDGKMIDLSGAMSGGGNYRASGMMKSERQDGANTFTAEEVHRIDAELVEREKNFQVASETLREMEEALQKLKDREPEIELDISKREMDIESLLLEIKSSEQKLANLRKEDVQKNSSNNDLCVAEANAATLRNECKELKEEMRTKNCALKDLQEQIMKIGGTGLQMQNSKVESITQHIEIILGKQKTDKAAIRKAESDLRRFKRQDEDLTRDAASFKEELHEMESALSEASERLCELDTELEKLSDECASLDEEFKGMEELLEQKSNEDNGFKVLEVDINNQLEKLQEVIGVVQREHASLQRQIDALRIRDVTTILEKLDENILPDDYMQSAPDVSEKSRGSEVGGGDEDMMDVDMLEKTEEQSSNAPDGAEAPTGMEIDSGCDGSSSQLIKLSLSELELLDVESIALEIDQLKDFIDNAHIDIEVLDEYAKSLADFRARKLDLNSAVDKREQVRQVCEDLKKKRLDEFMDGFNAISMTLKEMYQMITMGGNAELELVDSLDPFSEGVLFSVMPPKKSWRNISNLSGGEKTLSSLALVFALHKYKPTPLYVMDEIDAALDFRNVSIVANYIKERTKNAQFIVISLRNNMFELAQQLVGIYKNSNMTKSVALQNKDLIDRS